MPLEREEDYTKYDDFYIATKAEAQEQLGTARQVIALVESYLNEQFKDK